MPSIPRQRVQSAAGTNGGFRVVAADGICAPAVLRYDVAQVCRAQLAAPHHNVAVDDAEVHLWMNKRWLVLLQIFDCTGTTSGTAYKLQKCKATTMGAWQMLQQNSGAALTCRGVPDTAAGLLCGCC